MLEHRVIGPGFQEQDVDVGGFGQPGGHDATSGAAAYYDVAISHQTPPAFFTAEKAEDTER